MADEKVHAEEPRGFGEHKRGLASEYAHEQGWGLNEDERKAVDTSAPVGGTDYEYGAQDFGDTPVNTSEAKPAQSDVDTLLKD